MTGDFLDGKATAVMMASCGVTVVDGAIRLPSGGIMGFWNPKPQWMTDLIEKLPTIDANGSPFRWESFA